MKKVLFVLGIWVLTVLSPVTVRANDDCDSLPLPWSEDFESVTVNGNYWSTANIIDSCWYVWWDDYSTMPRYTTYGTVNSLTKCVRAYLTYGSRGFLATPPVEEMTDSIYCRFRVYYEGPCLLLYGLMNAEDTSTFVAYDTIPLEANAEWTTVEFTSVGMDVSGNLRLAWRMVGYSDGNVYLDDIFIDHGASCLPPYFVHSTYVDSTTVTLEWNQNGGHSSGFVVVVDDTVVLNTPSPYIDITDLEPDHEYNYTLWGVCDDDKATQSVGGRFRTICHGVEVPYTMDFDSVEIGEMPECWRTMYGEVILPYYGVVPGVASVDSSRSLRLISRMMVATPIIMAPGDSLHVWFDLKAPATARVEAGVLLNATDTASFVALKTVEGGENIAFTRYDFYTENIVTNGYVSVAFRWTNTDGGWLTGYIDNVYIELMGPCHAPSETFVDDIGPTSVTLRWVDHSYLSSGYELCYSLTDDITTCDTSNNVITLDTFYYFYGLEYNQAYYFWVRSLCPEDSARWIPFGRFRTTCGTATLPYSEGFESYVNGESVVCWTYNHSHVGTTTNPIVIEQSTYAHSGNALQVTEQYVAGSEVDTLMMLLPAFGTRGDELEVSFWYHGYNGSNTFYSCMMQAGLLNMVTHEFVPAVTVADNTGSGNDPEYFIFATDTLGVTDSVRVAFIWYANSTMARGSFDDIQVRFIPLCRAPDSVTVDNITDTSAMIHIHDPWHTGYYRIHYEAEGVSGTVYTYSSDQVIEGLQHSLWYDVSVNGICFDGTSTDVIHAEFATQCLVITHDSLPYIEDFDSYSTTGARHISPCWNTINTAPAASIYPCPQNDSYGSDNVAMTYNVLGGYNYQYVVLPEVDYLNDLYLEFDGKTQYVLYTEYSIEVGVMTDPDDPTTFTLVASMLPMFANVWETFQVMFNTYMGNGRHVAIRVSTGMAWIDNVALRQVPACSETVHSLAVTDVGSSCATVGWKVSMGYNEDSYYVIHLTDTLGNPVQTVTTEDAIYTLCNLAPQTSFRFYVELVCDSSVTATSPAMGFTTQCEEYSPISIGTLGGLQLSYIPMSVSRDNSVTQQLYFSEDMQNTAGTLTDISFKYNGATVTDNATCNIYLCLTTDTVLTHRYPTSAMTRVYSGPLNLHTGWINFSFERPFHFNGTSNIIVAVETDMARPLLNTNCQFQVSMGGDSTCLVVMNDTTLYITQYRNGIRFNLCPDEVQYCTPPVIDDIVATDHSLTVDYTSDMPCEVHIARGWWNRGFTGVMADSSPYTFEGLTHSTIYTIGIRKHCAADDVSIWTLRRVSTLSIDALPPLALEVSDITFSSASVSWSRAAEEHFWQVHFFNTIVDTIFTVYDTNYTFTGLRSNYAYNFCVRSVYGSGNDVFSPWSDTAVFTTDYCRVVDTVMISNVTMTTAHISWVPGLNGNAWRIEYGYEGFSRGEADSSIVVVGQTYTDISGLTPGSTYNLYVRTLCDSTHMSLWTAAVNIYTPDENGSIDFADDASLVLYPNPAVSAVTVRLDGAQLPLALEIVDVNGRAVLRQTLAEQQVTIPLADFAKGVYFVRLTGDGYSLLRKLVVE